MNDLKKSSLVFLCGCLEPGHDGVGDYTRQLATELGKHDWQCHLIALNDKHVSGIQTGSQNTLPAARFSVNLTASQRAKALQDYLDTLSHFQIIVQYVPFAYHHKGLPYRLFERINEVFKSHDTHWMCHEIWCGLSSQSRPKERLLGWLQKQLLAKLLTQAKSIGTSNPDYQARLHKLTGRKIEALPLFGNIPFAEASETNEVRDISSEPLRIVLFGRIATDFPTAATLTHLNKLLATINRTCVITSIGRIDRGEAAWAEFSKKQYSQIAFKRLGEMPACAIDETIRESHFGLATTPLEGIGKSGTSIAILERGIPIIGCLQRGGEIGIFSDTFPENQIIKLESLSAELLSQPPTFSVQSLLPTVAKRQLEILERC